MFYRLSFVFLVFFILPYNIVVSQERLLKKAENKLSKNEFEEAYLAVQQFIQTEGAKTEADFMLFRIELARCEKIEQADKLVPLLNKINYNYDQYDEAEKKKWCDELSFCASKLIEYQDELNAKLFKLYTQGDKILLLRSYLEKYPTAPFSMDAKRKLSELTLLRIRENPKVEELNNFLAEFVGLPEHNNALNLLWEIVYATKVKIGTEEAYLTFIKEYPAASQVKFALRKAQEIFWNGLLPSLTVSKLEKYLNKYPDSYNQNEAENILQGLVWATLRSAQQLEMINDFINRFPNSIYADSALSRIKLLSTRVVPHLNKRFKYTLKSPQGENSNAPSEFDDVTDVWRNGYFVVRKKDKLYLWNSLGKEVLPTAYQSLFFINDQVYFAQINNRWGVMNFDGEYVVDPTYQSISITPDNHFIISKRENNQPLKYGILDKNGKSAFEPFFDELTYVKANCFKGKQSNKYFLLTSDGRRYSKSYTQVQQLRSGYYIGYNLSEAVMLDSSLKEVAVINGAAISDLEKYGVADLLPGDKYVFRSMSGEKYMELEGVKIRYIGDGLVALKSTNAAATGSWSVYSLSKKQRISKLAFESVGQVSEGLFSVVVAGKLGYLDTSGTMVISPRFDPVDELKNIFTDDQYFLGNSNGLITDAELLSNYNRPIKLFQGVERAPWERNPTEFQNGFSAVVQNGKIGFINTTGDFVIFPQYARATGFQNGIAMVQTRNFGKAINKIIGINNKSIAENYELIGIVPSIKEILFRQVSEDFTYRYTSWNVNTNQTRNVIEGVNKAGFAMDYFTFEKQGKTIFQSSLGKEYLESDLDWSATQSTYYLSVAKRYIAQRNKEVAELYLNKATNINPSNLEAWSLNGAFLIEIGRIDKANSLYNNLISQKIDSSTGYRGLVNLSLRSSSWSAAITQYQHLLSTHPKDSLQLLLGMATCQIKLQNIADAINTYALYVKLAPQSSTGYNNRGYCYLLQREFNAAFSDFNQAVKYSNNELAMRKSAYFNNRGIAHKALGNNTSACVDFTMGADLGNIDAMNNQRSYCN